MMKRPTTQWSKKKKKRVTKSRISNQHNIITKLPTEILSEIITRLPTSAIVSCLACNNKDLNNVISKSNFPPHPSSTFLGYGSYDDPSCTSLVEYRVDCNKIVSIPLNLLDSIGLKNPNNTKLRVLLSCNGWVLVHSRSRPISSRIKPVLHLVNPMTRRCLSLPITIKMWLGFHQRDRPEYGMGCSRTTGEYKVVRLTKTSPYGVSHVLWNVEVLELGRSNRELKWRRISEANNMSKCERLLSHPVALHGAVHWPILCGKSPGTRFFTVLRFDIDKEELDLVCPPYHYNGHIDFVGSVGDSLCVSITNYRQMWKRRDVWVMEEYGVEESWTVLFSIRHEDGSVIQVFEDNKMLIRSCDRGKLCSVDDDSGECVNSKIVEGTMQDEVYMYEHNNNKGSKFMKVDMSDQFSDLHMTMLPFVPNYKL